MQLEGAHEGVAVAPPQQKSVKKKWKKRIQNLLRFIFLLRIIRNVQVIVKIEVEGVGLSKKGDKKKKK